MIAGGNTSAKTPRDFSPDRAVALTTTIMAKESLA
jgi:hypothetical protein